jgi:hypothetical protein
VSYEIGRRGSDCPPSAEHADAHERTLAMAVEAALAGEVVVDYSLRLKRELAGPAVWVAALVNGVKALS